MIYNIEDKPPINKALLYALQLVLSVIVATVLIANICGTPIDSCLVGAGVATIIYQVITGFKSPMFISSCGATCSAVLGALAVGNNNYATVIIGGAIILLVYAVFSLIVKVGGVKTLNKIFPPIIVGPVTMVIGLNLATFIPTYMQVNGQHSNIGVLVGVVTMLVVAVMSHFAKGFLKTVPFLIGLLFGYALSAILTLTGVANLIDFSSFSNLHLFNVPDFTFKYADFTSVDLATIGNVIILFLPVAICALLEHYSDHMVLSNIVGKNLTETPGLHRTLLGDGVASFVGTVLCGLPNTSYGESIATTGFSKVASTFVLTLAAIMLMLLGFIEPVQVFFNSIPACVFAGCAMILYGFIADSGLKTIINSKIDLNNNKNLIIVSVILTTGVSGVFLFSESFAGVSLAMVLGVILNLVLKEKHN